MNLVSASVTDRIGSVRLTDAAHRNVLSPEMSDQLGAAVAEVLEQGAAALVLTADPPVFCSGGSLDALIERARPLTDLYVGFNALTDCPVPTIAVVCGAAIGAGVNLPLACDVIIAGQSAKFDPRFLDVGIHPGGGHLWRLMQRVGEQGAAALSLCGDSLDGAEAAAVGLAWRCVADEQAEALAIKFAKRAASRDSELVRRTKQTIRDSRPLTTPQQAAELELVAQQWSVDRPDFADGVRRIQQQLAARR
ncbi:MAG TPA: enoyl-CoA hydratase-related protein [Ilumatobacteraceae bacterium]|nr:enoyl-CoA hydratase-related protein [Ilumatobacteraceae bacterium]